MTANTRYVTLFSKDFCFEKSVYSVANYSTRNIYFQFTYFVSTEQRIRHVFVRKPGTVRTTQINLHAHSIHKVHAWNFIFQTVDETKSFEASVLPII